MAGNDAPTVVTAVPVPLIVTDMVRPSKLDTPQPFTALCTRKQYAPVVLKFPELPPVATGVQLPPPELELLELEELDELLLDDELELEEDKPEELELLDDELELLDEELLLDEGPPLIVPMEAVSVTLSSLAPSSRLSIRNVCEPAARLLKVAGVIVP